MYQSIMWLRIWWSHLFHTVFFMVIFGPFMESCPFSSYEKELKHHQCFWTQVEDLKWTNPVKVNMKSALSLLLTKNMFVFLIFYQNIIIFSTSEITFLHHFSIALYKIQIVSKHLYRNKPKIILLMSQCSSLMNVISCWLNVCFDMISCHVILPSN